jgi:hypothetical protein
MSTDTMASNTAASPTDEYLRLQARAFVAEVTLNEAKRKTEEAKVAADMENAERDKKVQASREFSDAYHAWLIAKAGIEEMARIEEGEQPARFKAVTDAERRLFAMPAAYSEELWQKLTAFEAILGEEMTIGLRKESILLLAVGSIKQDIVNLELFDA